MANMADDAIRAVRRSIDHHVRELADIAAAVAAWDGRRDAEAMIQQFRIRRLKCEAYADLLGQMKAVLDQAIANAEAAMRAGIADLIK